jgi:ABC-2 type transport system permease protein
MFYPLEPLPRGFRLAALANPITWQIDVLRYATIGIGHPQAIAIEAAAFLVFTAASFAMAIRALEEAG